MASSLMHHVVLRTYLQMIFSRSTLLSSECYLRMPCCGEREGYLLSSTCNATRTCRGEVTRARMKVCVHKLSDSAFSYFVCRQQRETHM